MCVIQSAFARNTHHRVMGIWTAADEGDLLSHSVKYSTAIDLLRRISEYFFICLRRSRLSRLHTCISIRGGIKIAVDWCSDVPHMRFLGT